MDTAHIRLVCWEEHHVQATSPEALRQATVAPVCACGAAIWAVEHDGEPTRYVGRPPHSNWQGWADCVELSDREKAQGLRNLLEVELQSARTMDQPNPYVTGRIAGYEFAIDAIDRRWPGLTRITV